MMNSRFEKCPYCGAWRLIEELENHIGVCYTYRNIASVMLSPENYYVDVSSDEP